MSILKHKRSKGSHRDPVLGPIFTIRMDFWSHLGLLFIHKHLRLFRLTNQANAHFSVRGRKEHQEKTHAAFMLRANRYVSGPSLK